MEIKILRIRKGIKLKDLAEKVGISREYLRQIENETANPSKRIMQSIAKELGSSVQELFFTIGDK